jgi:hypothetical protein
VSNGSESSRDFLRRGQPDRVSVRGDGVAIFGAIELIKQIRMRLLLHPAARTEQKGLL